jgi:hypothetical protein
MGKNGNIWQAAGDSVLPEYDFLAVIIFSIH